MSFILDALKKSENARQRQIGPAVAELPRRRRQSERPIWAFVVAGLLLVNIGVLGAVLARKKGDVQPVTSAAAMAANPAMAGNQGMGFNPGMGADPAMQQLPPDLPTALPSRQPAQYQQQYQQQPQQYPQQQFQQQQPQQQFPQYQQYRNEQAPAQFGPAGGNAGGGGTRSLAEESASTGLEGDSGLAAAFAAAQADIDREDRQTAPIQAPAVAPLGNASAQARSIPAGSSEVLPTIQELAASGRSFPNMKLDIHSFADKPGDRFIFVNMRQYREGSTLQEGPAVERITEEGVVLNQQGLRFLLPRP